MPGRESTRIASVPAPRRVQAGTSPAASSGFVIWPLSSAYQRGGGPFRPRHCLAVRARADQVGETSCPPGCRLSVPFASSCLYRDHGMPATAPLGCFLLPRSCPRARHEPPLVAVTSLRSARRWPAVPFGQHRGRSAAVMCQGCARREGRSSARAQWRPRRWRGCKALDCAGCLTIVLVWVPCGAWCLTG